MLDDEKLYWVALSAVPGIGGKTLNKLVKEFGCPSDVFAAPPGELLAIARVTEEVIAEMGRMEENLDNVRADLQALSDEGVAILTRDEDGFPRNLRWASDSPAVLYARGDMTKEDEFSVAVVGSRNASEQGVAVARNLAAALVEQGITVVSGLALGIDGAAHEGALQAEGRTLGVLGSGIRIVYPSENYELAERLVRHGAVLSELAPNTRPSGPNLMARDRIISGLSLGVIVVEAGEKSGSVDTAQKAKKQGRAVWVVDWPDQEEGHAGNRALLREGAEAVSPNEPPNVAAIQKVLLEIQTSLMESAAGLDEVEMDTQLQLF